MLSLTTELDQRTKTKIISSILQSQTQLSSLVTKSSPEINMTTTRSIFLWHYDWDIHASAQALLACKA